MNKKLSKMHYGVSLQCEKLPVKTPATEDRRDGCFQQLQNGKCFFIFKQILTDRKK